MKTRTVFVATLSPMDTCAAETLSTLKFAQRVKARTYLHVYSVEQTKNIKDYPILSKEIEC